MGKQGPCFHCSVKQTILWRNGPPEKPVLCNACGSRWRVRRTLDGYIPRHGNIEKESYQRPSDMKPARDEKKLEVGVEVSGQDGSSACLKEEVNNISSLGSAGSSSDNCMQMEETNAYKDPLWNPDSVPRRKRSERRKRILSPVERLQRQLHNILQEPDFENISADDENILIYASNKYIPPNEIGLGAMLLVSPPTATEHLTSQSPMAEDNDASCSVNVPVGNSNSNLRSSQRSSLES
ncbi:GATA transcription factor 26-like [Solanum stenotomum]|uniref:GATA transcription factor 26-like n=1 Tax=Solanum stenotomum TaxID=172797 RepID=UPI0020CFF639|nr:GATA transcription factor 26-like [Solanum stenotomum]